MTIGTVSAKGTSSVKQCPKPVVVKWCEPTHRFRSLATGAIAPAFCKTWRCGRCGPAKARRIMAVAYWAGNTRFVTLTLCGNDWQTRRNRVKRLTHALKAHGDISIVWCVEPNPAATGHHVHALVGGKWLPHRVWSKTCDSVGLGKVVTIAKAQSDGAGNYSVKAGLYSSKGCAGGPAAYAAWLELGGGRGVHWSRAAFGGSSYQAAYKAFCAAKGFTGNDPGPWVREELRRSFSGAHVALNV